METSINSRPILLARPSVAFAAASPFTFRLRNRYLLAVDVLLILCSVALTFVLRLDSLRVNDYLLLGLFFTPFVLAIRLPVLLSFGIYRRMWKYASAADLLTLFEACFVGSALIAVIVFVAIKQSVLPSSFPRALVPVEGLFTLLLIGGARFALLFQISPRRSFRSAHARPRKRILVFGAGDAGAQVVRELKRNPGAGLDPIAFIDDDRSKLGLRIHNVPVLGTRVDLAEIVVNHNIDEVLAAIPSATGDVIREISEQCREIHLPIRTIPALHDIIDGTVRVNAIREVKVADLLRRPPVTIDMDEVGHFLGGACILVTGAGGSIGSELCRQIARFTPSRLILLELSEWNLYQIHRELIGLYPRLPIVPVLADIRDAEKIDAVFGRDRPDIVFHAAAYKHVPMCEGNEDQAVHTNIFGTRNLIEASVKHHVKRFVFVSTDKAVNPTSVMGASKRVAELLVHHAAHRNGSSFVVVRFGNVLGSSGSVVPLFEEQIARGGPITVTHPEIERFFMTIPEAVTLIIQAAAAGKGGEIFVLNMGQAIRIQDLARDMIRLSGFDPDRDIRVAFTGLRLGEKMSEELFTPQEDPRPTDHPRIFVAKADPRDGVRLNRQVADLETLVHTHDVGKIRAGLQDLLPEYHPQ